MLQKPAKLPEDPSFLEWALATFGEGICKHFMIPYNSKLYCTDLASVSAEWVSWSIPKPTWADLVRGAQHTSTKTFGYNPSFLYPAAGGIDHLPNAFVPHVHDLRTSTRVEQIHAGARAARLSSGERVRYSRLISTMPLPALLDRIDALPPAAEAVRGRLRHVSVMNLNLGFDAPSPSDYHWVYFPEPEFPFYRVGIYSNLCPASVPAGHGSFYVEIAHRPEEPLDLETLVPRVEEALRRCGLVPARSRLVETVAFDIPYAYVIHDRERAALLPRALAALAEIGIDSIGRYGAWEYSAMEDAIWHGRLAAERALA